jgi:hypothetical protein
MTRNIYKRKVGFVSSALNSLFFVTNAYNCDNVILLIKHDGYFRYCPSSCVNSSTVFQKYPVSKMCVS